MIGGVSLCCFSWFVKWQYLSPLNCFSFQIHFKDTFHWSTPSKQIIYFWNCNCKDQIQHCCSTILRKTYTKHRRSSNHYNRNQKTHSNKHQHNFFNIYWRSLHVFFIHIIKWVKEKIFPRQDQKTIPFSIKNLF